MDPQMAISSVPNRQAALRKFKWKDCGSPAETRVAFIVDQEVFRMNIIFALGRNGRLYQYNRITDLWHLHYQSPHLLLSRIPGTAMRPTATSLTGSIFMVSEYGGLVEYHWSFMEGWEWVEHGTPARGVAIAGAPGPWLGGSELFVIGSNGCVYRRSLNERAWKWTDFGYPNEEDEAPEEEDEAEAGNKQDQAFRKHCNAKVTSIRPIPFSEDSLIFGLQDGRLAELRRSDEAAEGWDWVRIISTPTSLCLPNYWAAVAS